MITMAEHAILFCDMLCGALLEQKDVLYVVMYPLRTWLLIFGCVPVVVVTTHLLLLFSSFQTLCGASTRFSTFIMLCGVCYMHSVRISFLVFFKGILRLA